MRKNAISSSRQYVPHNVIHHDSVDRKKRSHNPFFLWPLYAGKRMMDKTGVIFFTIVADTSRKLDDCYSVCGIDAGWHA